MSTIEPTIEEVRAALANDDRNVDAIVDLFWQQKYPNNYADKNGMVARVYGVRPAPIDYEVNIGHAPEEVWVWPIEVRLGWNLCDGCKAPMSACCCDAIEEDREAEYGPWCDTCGCDGSSDYAGCIFAASCGYGPGECSQITGVW